MWLFLTSPVGPARHNSLICKSYLPLSDHLAVYRATGASREYTSFELQVLAKLASAACWHHVNVCHAVCIRAGPGDL